MRAKQTNTHEADPKESINTDLTIAPGEVVIAHFSGLNEEGQPLVEFRGFNTPIKTRPAITTVSLTQSDAGRQVVVMFVNQDPAQPVITGLVHSPLYDILETAKQPIAPTGKNKEQDQEQQLTVDGKRVLIEGSEEVVLKCGESSITLTKAGKILIRGKYLLNRSSGVNRIMGGSVQVN